MNLKSKIEQTEKEIAECEKNITQLNDLMQKEGLRYQQLIGKLEGLNELNAEATEEKKDGDSV